MKPSIISLLGSEAADETRSISSDLSSSIIEIFIDQIQSLLYFWLAIIARQKKKKIPVKNLRTWGLSSKSSHLKPPIVALLGSEAANEARSIVSEQNFFQSKSPFFINNWYFLKALYLKRFIESLSVIWLNFLHQ